MTKEQIARFEEVTACEEVFPGVLGNPVTFAVKWGLPLSKGYLADLERRKRVKTTSKKSK